MGLSPFAVRLTLKRWLNLLTLSPVHSGRSDASQLDSVADILIMSSGVTPIGQGWTNARGLLGLGGPKPDPIFCIFYYFKC